MKIAVLIKRVPDTEARIKIDSGGKGIDPSGVKFVLNPYDEYAVEEALKLKESTGSGEVIAYSVGGDSSQEIIRTALAMGADRGVLLKAESPLADPLPVAKALAEELRDEGYDLILCGKVAIDDYSNALGVMVAELLGYAAVSSVAHLELDGSEGVARREVEGGTEVVEFSLPAVITTDKGLNEPRYPALRGIMMAKKKPLEVKDVMLGETEAELLSLELPPPRKEGRIVGEGADAVPELIKALEEEARVL